MCYHSKQTKEAKELQNRFKAEFKNITEYEPKIYNGFDFPKTPIITNDEPELIQMFNWGLLPSHADIETFNRKSTLNARIETLKEKKSFKNSIQNRCLILCDGFYESQWLDEFGKQKQKYLLTVPDSEAFSFMGLWTININKATKLPYCSYSIITTEANELMSEIHNNGKRMPVIVSKDYEQEWLNGGDLIMDNDRILATPVEKKKLNIIQEKLF